MSLFVSSKNVVNMIVKNKFNIIKKIYTKEKFIFDLDVYKIIKDNGIIVENVNERVFNSLFKNKTNQNIGAEVEDFQHVYLNDIINLNQNKSHLLILDKIQDPHNFGAILRSALLFDISGVIVLDRNQCKITEAVVRASVGAALILNICVVNNLSNTINELKQKKYWIYCPYLNEKSIDINTIKFNNKSVIIIGNEGEGVSNKLVNISDFLIKINTNSKIVDSLNASVACGIILNKLFNKL